MFLSISLHLLLSRMCFSSQYYYSIKDISVGGMCICYGHAKACPLNNQTKVCQSTYSLHPWPLLYIVRYSEIDFLSLGTVHFRI